jgi:tetratricopeptide (TPR) repeat protein
MKKFVSVFSLVLVLAFVASCKKSDQSSQASGAGASYREGAQLAVTTSSQEAYDFYRQAWVLRMKGLEQESIPLMEKAIALDPEFAMAYRSLAASFSNIGGAANVEKSREYIQKAWEIAQAHKTITDREKGMIEAQYFDWAEGNYQKAAEVLQTLVTKYPRDPDANDYMGYFGFNREDWDLAIKHLALAIDCGATRRGTFGGLGYAYMAKGMYEEAKEVFRNYIANVSDDAQMHRNLADAYLYEGQYNKALEVADKAMSMEPNRYNKSAIFFLMGDLAAAEGLYKSWLEMTNVAAVMNGHRYLEHLYRMQGKYRRAKEEALAGLALADEKGLAGWKRVFHNLTAEYDLASGDLDGVLKKAEFNWESARDPELPGWLTNALWWKIRVSLERKDIEQALAYAEDVKRILKKTPSLKDDRWYLDNLGYIEMERGNYAQAIEHFKEVDRLQGGQCNWLDPHGYILTNLAKAYLLNGDLESAKAEYERILKLTTGRLPTGDLYVKAYFQLGKIHEEQGNVSGAVEHYEKFLDHWKDADPGLPEVEDARKRLAALKG